MLGYRSTFEVELDAGVGLNRDNAVDTLLGEGFTWLRKQKKVTNVDDLEPRVERHFNDGGRAIYTTGTTPAGTEYARLVYYDRSQPAGQWVTSLLIGLDTSDKRANPRIAIEIEAPEDPNNEGHPRWTARPKLARQYLEGYTCREHGLSMAGSPTYLTEGQGAESLIDGLVDTHRRNLVIVCAEDGTVPAKTWLGVMAKVTEQTTGQASVYVLDTASTDRFNALVSDAHAITPYSPRTFRPPVDIGEPQDGRRHKYLTAETMLGSRPDYLDRMYGRLCREHANAQPIDRFLRRLDIITGKELDRAAQAKDSAVIEAPAPTVVRRAASAELPERDVEVIATEVGDTCNISKNQAVDAISVEESAVPVSPTVESESASVLEVRTVEDQKSIDELIAEIGVLRAELDVREAVETGLRAALERANDAIRRLEAEREDEVLNSKEAIDDLERKYRAELENERLETLLKDEEARKSAEQVRTLSYQLERARRILADNRIDASGSRENPEVRYEQELREWEEIEHFGAEKFPNLVFTCDWKKMMDLASQDNSDVWLSTTWESLAMLDYYCEYRRTAEGKAFRGGMREYLKNPPATAWTIPADRFRASESEQVQGSKKYSDKRVFDVPPDVDPSGKATMLTHIVIQTKSTISPRLYFLDCTDTTGKIVIGYIGKHLRNTQTN